MSNIAYGIVQTNVYSFFIVYLSQIYRNNSAFTDHVQSAHPLETQYVCEFCDENLQSCEEYICHRSSTHLDKKEPYHCLPCGSKFTKQLDIIVHLANRSNKCQEINKCKSCGDMTYRKFDFRYHSNVLCSSKIFKESNEELSHIDEPIHECITVDFK